MSLRIVLRISHTIRFPQKMNETSSCKRTPLPAKASHAINNHAKNPYKPKKQILHNTISHVSRYPCPCPNPYLYQRLPIACEQSSRPHLCLRLLLLLHRCVVRWCERRSRIRQITNSFHEPGLLVVELVVVCAIGEEIRQEFEQALFVHDEEFLDFVGFVGVGGEDLWIRGLWLVS